MAATSPRLRSSPGAPLDDDDDEGAVRREERVEQRSELDEGDGVVDGQSGVAQYSLETRGGQVVTEVSKDAANARRRQAEAARGRGFGSSAEGVLHLDKPPTPDNPRPVRETNVTFARVPRDSDVRLFVSVKKPGRATDEGDEVERSSAAPSPP